MKIIYNPKGVQHQSPGLRVSQVHAGLKNGRRDDSGYFYQKKRMFLESSVFYPT